MAQPVSPRLLKLVAFGLAAALSLHEPVTAQVWMDPALTAAPEGAVRDVLVHLRHDTTGMERALPPGGGPERFAHRVAAQVDRLRSRADISQASLLDELRARGVPHRAFWVANVVQVRATSETLQWLAQRDDVVALAADAQVGARLPEPALESKRLPSAVEAVEWGVTRVRAPQVWALGYRGQGVVVGGQDTGYQWDHPALRAQYRGWNGSLANHDHNWRDAITGGAFNAPCGFASPAPCDDHNHGTHTMGTAVGDDAGANQIGVAPEARWIGCRNMNSGDGTPSTYLDCLQWFLAPTRIDGSDPRPDLAPHVMINSWGCPPEEGCTDPGILAEAVANAHEAGIFVAVSAGNAGSSCSTVTMPPAIYPQAFTVGATDSSDAIAGFSSRGPGPDGRLHPDISAPGVGIRSSIRNGGYGHSSGTSMAGPHVAGVAALLMSVDPTLIGDPDRVAALLRATARPATSGQSCPGFPGSQVPNAVFGHGHVDALAALAQLLPLMFEDGFEDEL